ncbi:Hpt domain-containing protein [Flavobacterium gelidilacus]|mgnify:FL=1|uniref:Hpt domain-containing protein n=1 Tax=Flavobacterium gelidilacus TaxID=206041 RepID=UPI000479CC1B|nr:Hpt domain-containing protein [Flavobacterium gelidilacus]|tara:strand:- start:2589 stop:2936 length:348 start_codon:yes stop_codon:yes gene_type:complete
MAIHYNLAKVYDISSNDVEFVNQILTLFLEEVPFELKQMKEGIKIKDFKKTYAAAHKIKPTLDLLGVDLAYEEVNQIMAWTKKEGKKKEVKEVFKLLKEQVDLASKEIRKNHNIK